MPYMRGSGRSAEELYQATLKREECLRKLGFKVESIFECEFRQQMSQDPEMKAFVDNAISQVVERLNPRDAFFGGRTNATRLSFKQKPGDARVLKYFDITSLYPFINKTSAYPIGMIFSLLHYEV